MNANAQKIKTADTTIKGGVISPSDFKCAMCAVKKEKRYKRLKINVTIQTQIQTQLIVRETLAMYSI